MPRRSPADPAAALAPRRTTLPGGLRVVTEFLPAVHSASVGVWVGVGSRDEGATVAGAAHFLEHLLFKSTPTRSAVDIAQAMDAVGGELNAFTAKEHTCYYAHVLGSDLPLAVDLVADVVLNGRCAADDVEVERDVVLEEIAIADVRPEVVSFTFGAPPPDVVQRLSALGLLVSITVTSVYEAGVAIAAGADSLVVQGPAAGGHRGTFAPDMEPGTESLHQLLDRIGSAHDVPLVAAGGLGTAEDVAAVLRRGAIAAQVGTALLLADEAGTNAAHRAALKNPEFDATLVTRAFSGRYARGLANNFTRLLDHVAPLGYPEVHQMTKPIRAAAVQADDPHGTNLWAGSAHRKTRPGPAADIIASLTPDVCSA